MQAADSTSAAEATCLEQVVMDGSVVMAPGVDLTAPVELDPFDAESGLLHR